MYLWSQHVLTAREALQYLVSGPSSKPLPTPGLKQQSARNFKAYSFQVGKSAKYERLCEVVLNRGSISCWGSEGPQQLILFTGRYCLTTSKIWIFKHTTTQTIHRSVKEKEGSKCLNLRRCYQFIVTRSVKLTDGEISSTRSGCITLQLNGIIFHYYSQLYQKLVLIRLYVQVNSDCTSNSTYLRSARTHKYIYIYILGFLILNGKTLQFTG